jgi:hypothetical protein
VDLETFIVSVFVHVDDLLTAWLAEVGPLRTRGPAPILHDSEVLTMEVVGEFLGLDQDRALVDYFRAHHRALFPRLATVHRTTFARQAANLWVAKEALWQQVVAAIPHDPALALIDSVPAPVCRRAHAPRCRAFRAEASFGWDASSGAFYYGLRHHLRVSWPGIVTAISVAPANVHDQELVPELVAGVTGLVLADRNYWNPRLREELAAADLLLLTPFHHRSRDPTPAGSRLLDRVRRRIETTASQLVERYHLKRIRARDAWHLTGRILRKLLSHSLAVLLNVERGLDEPRQLRHLLATT